MKFLKKVLFILSLLFLFFANISCGSTKIERSKATLTREPERMFWKISGTDSKGNPSYVYILGTIHVGDEKLYPLQENIVNTFSNADRILGELSYEDITVNLQREIQNAMFKSVLPNGKSILNSFNESQKSILYERLGDKIVDSLSHFEPWALFTVVQNISIANNNFNVQYGLDLNLYAFANKLGKSVNGLEELQYQLDIVAYGDYETQIQMIKDTLADAKDNTEIKLLNELYASYLNNDVDKLEKIFFKNIEKDLKKNSLYKDYYKKVIYDRNENWAKKIDDLLNEGGTTFIFAGFLHFVGENSVFDIMKKNQTLN